MTIPVSHMTKRAVRISALTMVLVAMMALVVNARTAVRELAQNRTLYSKDILNDDGTITRYFSSLPLFYKDISGNLKDIDTSIESADYTVDYGFASTRNVFNTFFPKHARGKLKLEVGESWITIRPVDASGSKPTVEGSSITYAEAWPGVDLKYTVLPGILKEGIVIKDRYSVRDRFSFEIDSSKLIVRPGEQGALLLEDRKGEAVFIIPTPYMYDSSDTPILGEARYDIRYDNGKTIVDIVPNSSWLARADINYPVIVDPTVTVEGAGSGSTALFTIPYPQTFSYQCEVWGNTIWFFFFQIKYDGHFEIKDPSGQQTVHWMKSGSGSETHAGNITATSSQVGQWSMRAWGTNGASGGRGSVTFQTDTTPPTPPGIPQGTGHLDRIGWTWSPSSDTESGIDSYEVKIGTISGGEDVLPPNNIGNVTSYTQYLSPGAYYLSVRAKDKAGNWSEWSLGQGVSVAATLIATYDYNMLGQVTRLVDGRGQITEYELGLLGVIEERYKKADGTQSQLSNIKYERDNLGNVMKKSWNSDPNYSIYDKWTNFEYDEAGRLIRKSYSWISSDVRYQYDTANNLTKEQYIYQGEEPYYVNTDYYYTARNSIDSYTQNINGRIYTVDYQTSNAGTITSITYPSTGTVINYDRDLMGRLTNVRNGAVYYVGSSTTPGITYRNTGFIEKIEYANNMAEEFTPDIRNRVDRIKVYNNSTPTTPMLDLDYTLDGEGNVRSIGSDAFTYDSQNRLISATVNGETTVYNLDSMGNRVSMVDSGGTKDYTTIDHNILASAGTTTYTYDSLGNLVTRTGGFEYRYDEENRLVKVLQNSVTIASYWYDAKGNRVKGTESGDIVYYLYDGLNVIQEDNSTAGTKTDYIFAGLTRIAEKAGDVVRYYHGDHLGSTRVVTDSSGVKVAEYKYSPYGNTLAYAGPFSTDYKFTGKPEDAATGLYYYGARFYDPEVGRFLTLDPAKNGLNWYAYANNNPIRFIDPDGKIPIDTILDVGFLIYDTGRAISGDESAWVDVGIDAASMAVPYVAAPVVKALKSGSRVAMNWKRGMAFEKAGIDLLGFVKNTENISGYIADVLIKDGKGLVSAIIEFKDAKYLYLSRQLETFIRQAGQNFSLIISDRTVLSRNLIKMLKRTRAQVYIMIMNEAGEYVLKHVDDIEELQKMR